MKESRLEAARFLDQNADRLAQAVMGRHYAADPAYAATLTDYQRAKCLQDVRYHFMYLSNALTAGVPGLFADYLAWARDLLAGLGVRVEDVARNLTILEQAANEQLPASCREVVSQYVAAGMAELTQPTGSLPVQSTDEADLSPLAARYLGALLEGRRETAARLVDEAIAGGTDMRDLYTNVFQPTQREIGRLWQTGRITVAQEHYCTAATQLIIARHYGELFTGERTGPSVVVACVGGELHELPARMVSDFFEMAGWNSYYLGANTPTQAVIDALNSRKPELLAVSATMTFHLRAVADLIEQVRSSTASPSTKVMVGGYPFNRQPELWRAVGADGWAPDGPEAVRVAQTLVGA